jgi:hypothetical protein
MYSITETVTVGLPAYDPLIWNAILRGGAPLPELPEPINLHITNNGII